MPKIKAMIEGGKATAGAPLGPALGPLGVNIGQVVAKINEQTKKFEGMTVPVEVDVDSSKKTFEIYVGSPPTSALIKKTANAQKGAANAKTDRMGNLTMAQVKTIAESKGEKMSSYVPKKMAKEVIGTCDSMGITVEGKRAKEIMKDVDEGKYDSILLEK